MGEIHPFDPIFDKDSRVLILGSFPSVKSRENGFYYGHPQNRFWSVLAMTLETEQPADVERKKRMLLEAHVALWDSAGACEILGSADSSITAVKYNDMRLIFSTAQIRAVLFNGQTAEKIYRASGQDKIFKIPFFTLPSTSPANAAWRIERLYSAWRGILLPLIAD